MHGRSEVWYLSRVVPGPAESALSTHVLSRVYTALTERGLVVEKKQEFSEYLEKARVVEVKALEYSELMKSKVNNVFDGIAASVEAQRNEALQSVSQGIKEIWSQKEMMEVSLAQLDSFNRFADHTSKCTTNTSYVAMASQGIKLMERLKDTHGDEAVLDHKGMVIATHGDTRALRVPLNSLFALEQPSLLFYPSSGAKISKRSDSTVSFEVSLCDIVLKIFVLTQQCKYKPRTELKMYKNYQGLNRENSVK